MPIMFFNSIMSILSYFCYNKIIGGKFRESSRTEGVKAGSEGVGVY